MNRSTRWSWGVVGLSIALVLIVAIGWALAAASDNPPPAAAQPRLVAEAADASAAVEPTTTHVTQPSATATIAPTIAPPTPTSAIPPTPTPIPAPRVGLQVGHWQSNELPEELANLRGNTGAFTAGYSEADVNRAVTERVATLLEAQGVIVDVLPATVPIRYQADAFVAIHADGSSSTATRGFKIATPWRTSPASQHLNDALTAEYAAATGLPQDGRITFNMRGYYAFSWRRFDHAIDRITPAAIVEMGFLSSPTDRALMIGQPDVVAVGIANGILRYLNERDITNTAALEPPNISVQRVVAGEGALIRSAPDASAGVVFTAKPDQRLMPFELRNGWYQVVVRDNWNVVGWVRVEDVQASNDSLPGPGSH